MYPVSDPLNTAASVLSPKVIFVTSRPRRKLLSASLYAIE